MKLLNWILFVLLISYIKSDIWKYVWDNSINSFVWICVDEEENDIVLNNINIPSTSHASASSSVSSSSSSTKSKGVGTPPLIQECPFCKFLEKKNLSIQLNSSFPKRKFNPSSVRRFNLKKIKLNNVTSINENCNNINLITTTTESIQTTTTPSVAELTASSCGTNSMTRKINNKRKKNKVNQQQKFVNQRPDEESNSNIKHKSTNTEKLLHFCSNCGLLNENNLSNTAAVAGSALSTSKIRRTNKRRNCTNTNNITTTTTAASTTTTTIKTTTVLYQSPELQTVLHITHIELKRKKKNISTL